MSTVLVGRRALDMISEAHVFIFFFCVCVGEWQDKLHANDCFAATIGSFFFFLWENPMPMLRSEPWPLHCFVPVFGHKLLPLVLFYLCLPPSNVCWIVEFHGDAEVFISKALMQFTCFN